MDRYCGDAEQWARFDAWAPTVEVTCRPERSGDLRCLSAQQWVSYEKKLSRRRAAYLDGLGFPDFGSSTVINPSSGDYIGAPAPGQCCLP